MILSTEQLEELVEHYDCRVSLENIKMYVANTCHPWMAHNLITYEIKIKGKCKVAPKDKSCVYCLDEVVRSTCDGYSVVGDSYICRDKIR